MSKKDIDLNNDEKNENNENNESGEVREVTEPNELSETSAQPDADGGEPSEKSPVSENNQKKSDKSTESKPVNGRKKRFKYGAMSVTLTVIFVAAVVLINVIFNMVSDRFDVSTDLSDNSIYSIDQTTVDYIKGIEDNVTITVTAEETDFENAGAYYKQVSEIVKTFAGNNPKVTAQYLDLDSNPAFYSVYGATLTAGSIIIESENTGRNVIVTPNDYLSPKYIFNGEEVSAETYSMYYQLGYGSSGMLAVEYYAAAEKCLLSGIMNVTNVDPIRVAVFTEDYGVMLPTSLINMLEANAYIVEEIKLSTIEKIDPDIDFAILFAPIYDLSNSDLDKIDMWLDNSGKYDKNFMYVAASVIDVLPNVNAYLTEWGISMESGYVFQTNDYAYNGGNTYQILEIKESEYSEGVDTLTKQTQGDRLKPIELLFDEESNYKTEVIVSSYDGAVVAPFDGLDDFDPSSAERSGAFPVVAGSSKTYHDGLESHQSRVYAVSGHYLLDRSFMETAYLNNSDIILNIFNVACGKENTEISLSPKSFSIPTLQITASQVRLLTVVFAAIVPLAVAAVGVVVIVRRKRR